jgi:hypothetical protein
MTGRRGVLALAVAAIVSLPACDGGGEKKNDALDNRLQSLANAGVFVGGVAFTNTLVAMHFERPGKDKDISNLRIFVADGAPGGAAEWFEGKPDKNSFKFTSASGKATIEGKVQAVEADGTVTLADGQQRVFFTRPAGHAAGVFEVTVDAGGNWTGTSLDGSTLEATQTGPTVDGFVRSASGDLFNFKQNDLTRRLNYSRQGGQPDTYTLIVTRQATEIVGRGGAVRQGRPSDNIVALDLAASPVPTPGVYYGRVAMVTDKLAFDIKDQGGGRRQVRAYLSDAEPEPAGDIEWFSAATTGDTFSVTSAMRDARIDGAIAPDGVSGTVTLPDGVPRRYFAGPAGEGAGIYDVTVAQDRSHMGTSEEGGKLELAYKDGMVMGQVTTPTGEKVDLLGADLTEAYKYGIQGSVPDTYVAFAAPRGRFLIGRSGDVRAGTAGRNIIGLDKKC